MDSLAKSHVRCGAYWRMFPLCHRDADDASGRELGGIFRKNGLPILIRAEAEFAGLFDPDMGGPSRPVALVLGRLVERFKDNTAVNTLEEFALLQRLLAEQCNVTEEPRSPRAG